MHFLVLLRGQNQNARQTSLTSSYGSPTIPPPLGLHWPSSLTTRTPHIPRAFPLARWSDAWLRVTVVDGMCIITVWLCKSIAMAVTRSVLGSWQVSDRGSFDAFHVKSQNNGSLFSTVRAMIAVRFVAPLKVFGGKNSNEKNFSLFFTLALILWINVSLGGLATSAVVVSAMWNVLPGN